MSEPLRRANGGCVVWLTGLPSSGKSTLAAAVHAELVGLGVAVCTLDGDVVRAALVPKPGDSRRERDDFHAALAHLAALLAIQGLTVLVPATAHRTAYRADARAWAPCLVEVHVRPAAEERREVREPRGHRAARTPGLPAVDLDYEAPSAPEIVAEGGRDPGAVAQIVALLRRAWEGDE
jgi:adenylylsulfate kinase